MATTFYLPSSGTSPLPSLALNGSWESNASGFFRAPLVTEKTDTPLTNVVGTFPSTSTQQMCFAQFVSPLSAGTYLLDNYTSLKLVARCVEGNAAVDAVLALHIYTVTATGTFVRTVRSLYANGSEFPTAATSRIWSYLGNAGVYIYEDERLVVEVGAEGTTPSTSYTATIRFGDPSDTPDLSVVTGGSEDHCPNFVVARDMTFKSEGSYSPSITRHHFISADGVFGG